MSFRIDLDINMFLKPNPSAGHFILQYTGWHIHVLLICGAVPIVWARANACVCECVCGLRMSTKVWILFFFYFFDSCRDLRFSFNRKWTDWLMLNLGNFSPEPTNKTFMEKRQVQNGLTNKWKDSWLVFRANYHHSGHFSYLRFAFGNNGNWSPEIWLANGRWCVCASCEPLCAFYNSGSDSVWSVSLHSLLVRMSRHFRDGGRGRGL